MQAVDIGIKKLSGGFVLVKATFLKNWGYYLQEALGLSIFMVSACFFSGVFFGERGFFISILPETWRHIFLGLMMGLTALYIFYSPLTSSSGSHINPAVTATFFRLNKIGIWDALFYIIFQFIGGTVTVYGMAALMGSNLTAAPLHDVVTVPGEYGTAAAAITEMIIAFIMMYMILFTTDHRHLKKYTRIFAGALVCIYVIIAGPVSGFGMNPARSFASALPANVWTDFWIYLFVPFAGMLAAAEVFLRVKNKSLTENR